MFNVGRMYRQGKGVRRNVIKATQWLQAASQQGEVNAHYMLGCIYARGDDLVRM